MTPPRPPLGKEKGGYGTTDGGSSGTDSVKAGVMHPLPKPLQPPPEEAKVGAVLNNVLGRNHEENICHLIDVVDRRWV